MTDSELFKKFEAEIACASPHPFGRPGGIIEQIANPDRITVPFDSPHRNFAELYVHGKEQKN